MIMQSVINIKDKITYLILILLGISSIYYQINFEDLWLDEMSSFWVADPSLSYSETINRQKYSDWHNPILFNIILKNFLNLVGYNPDLARYLPSLFGSLSFFMIGLITFQEKKDNTFLLSTFLACSSIYLIKYSQELRPYSLLFFSSALNIFFYIKMLRDPEKKNIDIFLFIFFSVINYSVNPFSLIIYFSQITYLVYRSLFFREKHKSYLITLILIFFFYLLFNYNYILYQITFDNYMLSNDIMNVIDGLYFPRFFGSKIMGYFYLFLLISLIFKNRKSFFEKNNNYLFFLILIFFSYLAPLSYGLIRTPVLHDRYIIFILIPIFIIIPLLLNEISNEKIKRYLVLFVIILTLSNHYIEIFQRSQAKPEFKKTLIQISNENIKNIVFDIQEPSFMVSNYINNIKIFKKAGFIYHKYEDYDFRNEDFWLLCYSTNPNYNCDIGEIKNFKVIDTKKNLFVETKLYSFK